jgi:hypothetical protein
MKIRAPFHVGTTFEQGWELFSFRPMVEWIGEVRWDYYFTQRLQTQAERLKLRHECEKALFGRKRRFAMGTR